ncbi:ATPase [Paenibacillus albiflavus]|uniref:ATPase n=1 Tax=Paenibacillus albiflavus TaxID=2545760 RepID=A0A4R4ECN7_9BACL|nr:BadF/BadG/BcrA/BcrD ATPase family protein [Paenibacillus albiflavus]TCZ77704.1 ATPase [Paenibacillus albiflavus]
MAYYLGMDAGGTKTNVIITDDRGVVVGKGKSKQGNHQTGQERAFQSYRESVDEALRSAGLQKSDITYAVFGLAGADREADFEILRPAIQQLGFANWYICVDAAIGMRAGTRHPYGICLICGTGTNCVGINKQGEVLQVGGMGYMYGDFGGGADLKVQVFRSVTRAWQGRGPSTMLTELTLDALGFESVDQMYNTYLDTYREPPNDLARVLFTAVKAGDEVAKNILQYQGRELGLAARACATRLNMLEDSFDIVLAGSIVTRGEDDTIHNQIAAIVGEVAPKHRIVKLEMEPVVGAIYMAMDRAGVNISEEVYEQLSTFQMDGFN